MLKCRYADEYKALHAPKCDNGRGCEACKQRWHGKQQARARQLAGSEESLIHWPKEYERERWERVQ